MTCKGESWRGRDIVVSVVIPAYEVQDFIAQTLGSVLQQTMPALEVLVVDDASRDATAAIVAEHERRDPRVRLVRRQTNGGVCRARNAALDLARGRWVAFVDSDDWLDPERLAELLAAADRLDADWVADDQLVVDDATGTVVSRVLRDEPAGARLAGIRHLIDRDPPERIGYGTLKPLVRRSFLLEHGVRFRVGLERFEDFAFHVACGLAGARMALLNRPLYYYRRRPGSLTNRDAVDTLGGMLLQNATVLEQAAAARAEAVVAALTDRDVLIHKALEYRSLLARLRQRDLAGLAGALRSRPSSGLSLLAGLSRAARGRLARVRPAIGAAGRAAHAATAGAEDGHGGVVG